VANVALRIGQRSLPEYAHRFSPRKFTQPQLFACLVLKAFFKTDYRGISAILEDVPDLRDVIGLRTTPHFTTLQKAAGRLLCFASVRHLLYETVRTALGNKRTVPCVAIDSTGFELTHASRYYIWRAKHIGAPHIHMTYRRFGKLHIICDTATHIIVGLLPCRGPTPDVHQLHAAMTRLIAPIRLHTLVADAGYDSESNHVFMRERLGIRSVIPPKHGRPAKHGTPPAGRWRRVMKRRFDHSTYRHRSQAETTMSMIKRNQGSCLAGRSYWSQNREMSLKALTHNIAILQRRSRAFLQSRTGTFFTDSLARRQRSPAGRG